MGDSPALALMRELGPLLDPAQIVYYEERAAWRIVIDENAWIDVVHDARHDFFMFQLDLGPLPEERQPVLHELLLRFNYLWTRSGGTYMALDDDGRAVLMYRHALAELDVTRLQALIGNLLDQALRWRELIQQEPNEEANERATPDDMPPVDAIPV